MATMSDLETGELLTVGDLPLHFYPLGLLSEPTSVQGDQPGEIHNVPRGFITCFGIPPVSENYHDQDVNSGQSARIDYRQEAELFRGVIDPSASNSTAVTIMMEIALVLSPFFGRGILAVHGTRDNSTFGSHDVFTIFLPDFTVRRIPRYGELTPIKLPVEYLIKNLQGADEVAATLASSLIDSGVGVPNAGRLRISESRKQENIRLLAADTQAEEGTGVALL